MIFSLKSRKAVNNPDIFKIQSIVRQVHSYPLKNSKSVYNVQVSKKTEKTAVLIVTPETGRLPDEMGTLARYISCKSGGLGEVVSALCEGLRERKLDLPLATLILKKRFQKEAIDEANGRNQTHDRSRQSSSCQLIYFHEPAERLRR